MNTMGFDAAFEKLREYIHEKSSFGVVDVSKTKEGETYPKIVVSDIENSLIGKTSGGIETHSLIGMEINIYAKTKKVDGKVCSGRSITRALSLLVDDVLSDICGMERVTARSMDNADPSIDRFIMRYNATQNDQRNYFF